MTLLDRESQGEGEVEELIIANSNETVESALSLLMQGYILQEVEEGDPSFGVEITEEVEGNFVVEKVHFWADDAGSKSTIRTDWTMKTPRKSIGARKRRHGRGGKRLSPTVSRSFQTLKRKTKKWKGEPRH